jgi:hypothetical protein
MRTFLETVVLLSTVPLLLPLWAWALDRAARGSIGEPTRTDRAPRMAWARKSSHGAKPFIVAPPRIPRIRSEQAD